MGILGVIVIVVGIVLLLVGRMVATNLPPNYQDSDDDFLDLLQGTGKLISGIGVFFLLSGVVCVIVAVVL